MGIVMYHLQSSINNVSVVGVLASEVKKNVLIASFLFLHQVSSEICWKQTILGVIHDQLRFPARKNLQNIFCSLLRKIQSLKTMTKGEADLRQDEVHRRAIHYLSPIL